MAIIQAVKLIRLTGAGDVLRLDPASRVTRRSLVSEGIKWHGTLEYPCCNIEVVFVSPTHYRLVCGRCGTLETVPVCFKTYEGLARWSFDKIRDDKPANQWGLSHGEDENPWEFFEMLEEPS